LLREFAGRQGQPTAMILDSRRLKSASESGGRTDYDEAKLRKGLQGSCDGRYAGVSPRPASEPGQQAGPSLRYANWPSRCN
jgi:hypothetical protein